MKLKHHLKRFPQIFYSLLEKDKCVDNILENHDIMNHYINKLKS